MKCEFIHLIFIQPHISKAPVGVSNTQAQQQRAEKHKKFFQRTSAEKKVSHLSSAMFSSEFQIHSEHTARTVVATNK